MTKNEKIELFDKWYGENYDEWAEGEEGIALREELEQAFKSGIATLEKENAELKEKLKPENCLKLLAKEGYIKFTSEQLTKAKELLKKLKALYFSPVVTNDDVKRQDEILNEAEQFLKESE